MRKYTIIIIDDESLARDSVKALLKGNSNWEVTGEAIDGIEAIQLVNQLKPDLIFLDIDMPRLGGMEVIKNLNHQPNIVFTTAYDTFAIKAFEENAVDYLLKPYTDKRFYKALTRVKQRMEERQSVRKMQNVLHLLQEKDGLIADSMQKIPVRVNDGIVLLNLDDILWVKAAGNYVELHTNESNYLHYDSMNNIEQILCEPEFIRIHRSYIVRRDQIKSLMKHNNGEYFVVVNGGVKFKLSRSNRDKVKRIIENIY